MASKPKEDGPMSKKRHKPEEIVSKLRQVDVRVSPGQTVADAIRSIGVTEVAAGRAAGWGDLLHPAGGQGRGRELATARQQRAPACLIGLPTTGSGGGRARLIGLAGCASP